MGASQDTIRLERQKTATTISICQRMRTGFLMDEGWMIANPDERRGRMLLDIIMAGGNFGDFSAERQQGFSFVGSLKDHIKKYELLRFDARETIWGELTFYGKFMTSILERIRRRSWTLR